MSKNLQKHWGFRKCAGLRRVVSLSSMRARAWKTTKVPSATRRTRLILDQTVAYVSSPVRCPSETLQTHGGSTSIDDGRRFGTSRLQPAFESRTTLRTDATSLLIRPMSRPSRSTRQWANSGPTARLPLWHSLTKPSPQRMGPPPEIYAPLGCGNSRAISHSLFVLSDPQLPSQRIAL